jgi:hypothetical protein
VRRSLWTASLWGGASPHPSSHQSVDKPFDRAAHFGLI